MRTFIKSALCLSLLVFLSSCDKNVPDDETYLIFGIFCGECAGTECVNIFHLSSVGIWEDQNDFYPGAGFSGQKFDFVELPQEKFELVRDFSDEFPRALLDETENQFGCPDCGDQCGYYVEWKDDGEIRSWTIDTDKDKIPSYLHDFVDQISVNITLLKE